MSGESQNHVIVHGYKPMGDQRVPDGLIRIEGHFADDEKPINGGGGFKAWQKQARQKFNTDAQAVMHVLTNNLPGGTLHELLVLMLQHKTNLYVVKE
jgi:hypothetical protein